MFKDKICMLVDKNVIPVLACLKYNSVQEDFPGPLLSGQVSLKYYFSQPFESACGGQPDRFFSHPDIYNLCLLRLLRRVGKETCKYVPVDYDPQK